VSPTRCITISSGVWHSKPPGHCQGNAANVGIRGQGGSLRAVGSINQTSGLENTATPTTTCAACRIQASSALPPLTARPAASRKQLPTWTMPGNPNRSPDPNADPNPNPSPRPCRTRPGGRGTWTCGAGWCASCPGRGPASAPGRRAPGTAPGGRAAASRPAAPPPHPAQPRWRRACARNL